MNVKTLKTFLEPLSDDGTVEVYDTGEGDWCPLRREDIRVLIEMSDQDEIIPPDQRPAEPLKEDA